MRERGFYIVKSSPDDGCAASIAEWSELSSVWFFAGVEGSFADWEITVLSGPIDLEGVSLAPPQITGYRNLGPEEVQLINEGKALAELVGGYVEKMKQHPTIDQRWVSIGMTDLQRGFMSVIRGIARPTTF